ncbi:MAG: two-component system response regulator [Desulfobulbaceae bacterium]|nr:two-component system response regulator [Desulfobulbaceae bacterium]
MIDLTKCSVLIVDDVEANIDVLMETLGDDFDVSVAMDGKSALESVAEQKTDLILLDIMMPGMSGYEVCEKLNKNEETRNIPIIFLTAMTEDQDEAKGLALGAVDYVTKPFVPELVKSRVVNHLTLKMHQDHLEDLVRERTRQLELTQEVTIECMGTLAEYRDPETGGHIKRIQYYVKLLADYLKDHPKFEDFLNGATIDLLFKSAPLHDIGKVGVRDNILLKPGKLTSEEFDKMKKHVVYGRDALAIQEKRLGKDSFLSLAREIAETHHEKWDGSGYPQGLAGDDIPISGRLMAVADVYDALISKRVYKPPFPHKKAVAIISKGKGQHFDPDIVDAFMELEEEFKKIAIEHADFDEERENLAD